MFVLYREGYEIYGVGSTPDEAKKDAGQWLEGGIAEAETAQMATLNGGAIGKLYIGACTDRLAAALTVGEEEIVFDWNENGLLDIVEGENVET